MAASLALAARTASASSCDELVASAQAHEKNGEPEIALRQYNDAVTLDPTCGPAWLGLGALRARTGDAAEAERVYDAALTHVPTLSEAVAGRARSRRRLGRADEAEEDMRGYADALASRGDLHGALAALVELASWFSAENRPPAELACWRRVAELAGGVDSALESRARATTAALVWVVGSADPVSHPHGSGLLRSVAARLRLR
ncbi:MAG TPA: tetratricopeptide repeat protein [Polyangiaceae bacterium]